MSSHRRWMQLVCAGLLGAGVLAAQNGQKPPAKVFYVPKPIEPTPYVAPMKPLVRLADLQAKHAGQANWSELIVLDHNNRSEVISAAPGTKVPRHLHSDAPEYWVVQQGKIRFEVEDPPGTFRTFEASKGDLILAPERHLHSLEVIGNEPAIRYQVTLPDTTTIYETKPGAPLKGEVYTPVTLALGDNPDEVPDEGKPRRVFFTIDELQKEHAGRRAWADLAIRKNRAHANVICGYAGDRKRPQGDLGHYHTDFAEMWVVMRGQQWFEIEGMDTFVASMGDMVYAPAKRWHQPAPAGEGMSCRLAMTPYPAGNHLYQPK